MQAQMVCLRHNDQVFRPVVVLVAVYVVDDLATPQRSAKHLLSDHPVLVPAVQFFVCGWFCWFVIKRGLPAFFFERLVTCDVVRVAITPLALRVHAAHSF